MQSDVDDKDDKDDNKFDLSVVGTVFDLIAKFPELAEKFNDMLNGEYLLPNIPFRGTNADKKIWDTLIECKGWRFQQHEFTRHCRILDPEGIRRAWGTKNGMQKALERLLGEEEWQKKAREWQKKAGEW